VKPVERISHGAALGWPVVKAKDVSLQKMMASTAARRMEATGIISPLVGLTMKDDWQFDEWLVEWLSDNTTGL